MQINDNPKVPEHANYEIIDAEELARRWGVPASWVYDHVRARCDDPIPATRLGKYVRFSWGSPKLEAWFQRQAARGVPARKKKVSKQENEGESNEKEIA